MTKDVTRKVWKINRKVIHLLSPVIKQLINQLTVLSSFVVQTQFIVFGASSFDTHYAPSCEGPEIKKTFKIATAIIRPTNSPNRQTMEDDAVNDYKFVGC